MLSGDRNDFYALQQIIGPLQYGHLTGSMADQAACMGCSEKCVIWAIPLVSVTPIELDQADQPDVK